MAVAGIIKIISTVNDILAAGATRPGQITVALPIEGLAASTNYATGTGSLAVSRAYYFSGSAAAAPTVINLSTIACTDGGVGFTHIRELIILNDDTVDTHFMTCFGGTTPFAPHLVGTTPTELIQPGCFHRVSKPLGTLGYAVGSTINLKIDPGAFTIPFRVYILGSGS